MKRRSFLALLGLAPVMPVAALARPGDPIHVMQDVGLVFEFPDETAYINNAKLAATSVQEAFDLLEANSSLAGVEVYVSAPQSA